MTNYLMLLSTVVLIKLVVSYRKNNPSPVPEKKITEKMNATAENKPSKNWIEDWFVKNNIQVSDLSDPDAARYRCLLVLHTCRVELRCFLNNTDRNFGADITFPVIIEDASFPAMNKVISGFNQNNSGFLLMLDKNEGMLHLRTQVSGDALNAMDAEQKDFLFIHLFNLTDTVFRETMRVVYGGTLPELAVIKMVGLRACMLN